MYYPDSVVNLHKKILKDAGLEHIRFHDLRHTFATLALQNGVDIKTVSSMLGHYDAGFTLRTYTHATRSRMKQRKPWATSWSRSCEHKRAKSTGQEDETSCPVLSGLSRLLHCIANMMLFVKVVKS